MTDSSAPGSLLDRLAAAPSRGVGIAAAALALAMMLVGAVLIPQLAVATTEPSDANGLYQLVMVEENAQALLWGNVLAFLGFIPLLTAVHALIGARARPVSMLLAAYLVLLIRPIALGIEAAVFPGSVLVPLGPLMPYLLLATTGVAAGLAATAILPLAQSAASPARRAVLGIGIGALVALALYSFAPYIAPLSALGVGVALLMRRGTSAGHDASNGPAGQN